MMKYGLDKNDEKWTFRVVIRPCGVALWLIYPRHHHTRPQHRHTRPQRRSTYQRRRKRPFCSHWLYGAVNLCTCNGGRRRHRPCHPRCHPRCTMNSRCPTVAWGTARATTRAWYISWPKMLVGQTHTRMNFAGSQAQGHQGFLPWGMARDNGDDSPGYGAVAACKCTFPGDVPCRLGDGHQDGSL